MAKGLFIGNSHANGGIPSEIAETGTKIEIEGNEYYICNEAYNSPNYFEFKKKTNKEILDFIYTEFACKLDQNVMHSGDFIVCKVVVADKKKKDRKGTIRDILNEMQGEKNCKVESGSDYLKEGGELLKRADGSYSKRGLWDNIRANIGSGRKPTKEMLKQEAIIREKYDLGGNIYKYSVNEFEFYLENKYNANIDLGDYKKYIYLSKILIPKEVRNLGTGTKIMNEIITYADKNDRLITLTPSTDYGATSVSRLKEFYKKFGFIENKGRNKNFEISQTMYRVPVTEKYHLGGDMSKHLAPNGKPSNLNHEQWHLVRTDAFKKWFGDWEKLANAKLKDSGMDEVTLANLSKDVSKVVDENGEPLVVYHGTKDKFSTFDLDKVGTKTDTGMWGKGFYFSSSKKYAETYSNKAFDYKTGKVLSDKGIVLNVFLSLKNPYIIKNYNDIPKIITHNEEIDDLINSDKIYSEKFRKTLIDNGYDGVFVKFEFDFRGGRDYELVAFESNQIKLADGTNTTFDSNNPDIRYEEGGMTYRQYVNTQFNEETDRYLPSDYLTPFEVKKDRLPKENYLLIKIIDGLEYRISGNSVVKVFDNDNLIAEADMGAIQVAEQYQRRGIGLELVTILKELNPNHRFGSMTPQGWNLLGKYYDKKIANNPDIRFDEGGNIEEFDWESLYNTSDEKEESLLSEEQEKEERYQESRFSKKWAATRSIAIDKLVKQYLDAKRTYDDWASREYKQNKSQVFTGGDDIFGQAKSISSINEGRRQRVLKGSKMLMDESIADLKEIGLTDSEIDNLINKKDKQPDTLFNNGGMLNFVHSNDFEKGTLFNQ